MTVSGWLKRGLAALGLAAAGCTTATPAADAGARPAMWRIADADTTVTLFGTIHMLPPAYSWRTDRFDRAIAAADTLVVETKIDNANPQALAMEMARLGLRDGLPPLLDRVPADKRAALAEALGRTGIPVAVFDRMETWAAAFTLIGLQFQQLGLKGEDGVEAVLKKAFAERGAPIDQLESNADQLGFFDQLSEPAQRELLVGAVDNPQAMRAQFDSMLKSWSTGDVAGIARSFNAEMGDQPELMNSLLKKRNANWARWINQRMERPGNVFVAVGAGHLAGEGSVLTLLEQGGWKVTRIQ